MKKVSQNEFEERLKNIYPDEHIEIIEYVNMSKPCTYKCTKCNHIETIYKAGDLTRKKHLCNQCWYSCGTGVKTQQYKEQALNLIQSRSDLEFIAFGYNKRLMKSTIKFKCNKCNSIAEFQLIYFLKHANCPHCSYNAKHLTTEGIKLRIPDNFTLLSDYQGCDEKVLLRHEDCGFIWKTSMHTFLDSLGCPKCNKSISRGEQKIINFLTTNNIRFEREKNFEWIGRRRFDFYLPDEQIVIEYMGIQHYQEVPHFNLTLERQQEIDNYKKNQALQHGLQYIDISYKYYDTLEEVLAQRLSQLGVGLITETESILRDEDIV